MQISLSSRFQNITQRGHFETHLMCVHANHAHHTLPFHPSPLSRLLMSLSILLVLYWLFTFLSVKLVSLLFVSLNQVVFFYLLINKNFLYICGYNFTLRIYILHIIFPVYCIICSVFLRAEIFIFPVVISFFNGFRILRLA